ncbi:hypothetical protein BUALT_Bualt05G0122300 [Buddleja alternifolia]|uniref:Uncharacterized protein n=1 Tax=Buddleja alternifolia TaxID=168488 RepID=A0AAV6XRS5_9LAMI|nr:hypothetical protein BUALT_Bualt05G0122300 [Buddleja alternifolia]
MAQPPQVEPQAALQAAPPCVSVCDVAEALFCDALPAQENITDIIRTRLSKAAHTAKTAPPQPAAAPSPQLSVPFHCLTIQIREREREERSI